MSKRSARKASQPIVGTGPLEPAALAASSKRGRTTSRIGRTFLSTTRSFSTKVRFLASSSRFALTRIFFSRSDCRHSGSGSTIASPSSPSTSPCLGLADANASITRASQNSWSSSEPSPDDAFWPLLDFSSTWSARSKILITRVMLNSGVSMEQSTANWVSSV